MERNTFKKLKLTSILSFLIFAGTPASHVFSEKNQIYNNHKINPECKTLVKELENFKSEGSKKGYNLGYEIYYPGCYAFNIFPLKESRNSSQVEKYIKSFIKQKERDYSTFDFNQSY